MSRRTVLLIALIALAVLGTAAAPWTLTGNGLATAVGEHLKSRYGLALKVEGRSVFALLPFPRAKFENVELDFPNQALKAKGGILRGELRLLPLIFGRVELSNLALSEMRLTGSLEAVRALNWKGLIGDEAGSAPVRNLIVTDSSLRLTDVRGANLHDLELVIRWAGPQNPVSASGSALWRGQRVALEEVSFYPKLFTSGQLSPVSLKLSAPSGSIAVKGEASLGDDPQMVGESAIVARSVRDFTRWSGMELPFGSLVQALSVKGAFSMNRRRLSWPSVAMVLGKDKLEGTVGVRFDTEKPLITGTLAADTLNLSDLFAPFAQVRAPSGSWSEEAIGFARTTGSPLDLRLSASTVQIGRLRLDDMAASVLVQPGKIEASIGRAGLHEGTLKGRLSLSALDGVVDFKAQGTFAKVDVAAFLKSVGEPRWITGRAQGQFTLEGSGRNPAQVMKLSQGRASIAVTDGELVGVALKDALELVDKRPLLASLDWRGGRTPFKQAQGQIVIKDGKGELSESRLEAPALRADLQGQVLLSNRTLDMKADISSPDRSRNISFAIVGNWDNVAWIPDARALIERSGAAKPLLESLPLLKSLPAASDE